MAVGVAKLNPTLVVMKSIKAKRQQAEDGSGLIFKPVQSSFKLSLSLLSRA